MRNFVSPNSHPSSFFTGSTLESMIDKTVGLDTGYYTCTDNGYLQNTFKAYGYAKKKGLKPILGCEIYIVDREANWQSKIKYYTLTLHAKNQEAYQFLVNKISEKKRNKITILNREYPTFDWSDLKDFSEKDFTVVSGGPQDLVCKNLLINDQKAAMEIFQNLRVLFGDSLYLSIIPLKFDKKWVSESVFSLTDGQTVHLDSSLMAETDFARNYQVSLEEVAAKPAKHKTIRKIYVNGIGYNVNKGIISAINHKDFKPIGLDIYEKYNKFVRAFSARYNIKLLINDYSYFSDEGDKLVQDLKLGEEARFYTKNSIKTTEEVVPYLQSIGFLLPEIQEMVDNTYEWASQFDDFELKYDYRLVNEYENPFAATMEIIKRVGRFDATNPVHVKQLRQEIEVIHNNGVVGLLPYFFPIEKAINYYISKGKLPGPARGSAGGSFLMFCMGITQVDPIKYELQFSRFLTLGRIKKGTLPDVDQDFGSRELLVEKGGFLDEHYEGRWSQVSTRALMRLKSAIRDVNRFKMGKVEEDIEKLAKRLPAAPQGVTDQDFVFGYESDGAHVPGLLEKDEKLLAYTINKPEEWEIVKRTLGISRQVGRHASAFVISDIPISDIIPTMNVKETENVTQYEADEVEAAGLIKYDFLVVKCLNDIELCMNLVNEKFNEDTGSLGKPAAGNFNHKGDILDIWDLPEEQEVFDMLADGATETIFQLHTVSVLPYIKAIRPKSVVDCAVITSLVRPGPLDFINDAGRNMAEEYVERVNGRSKGDIPILDKLLPETHGVFVFQEQITKLTKALTGWDDEKAEDIRIAVGKKKMKMIAELKPQFIEAAAEANIVDAATAKRIWDMMETFGGYGFNKSHAVAYAMIAYACAYMKHHYKLEWWASVLSNAAEKEITEVLWPHIRTILSPPDINLSKEEMVIDYRGGTIRNKLSILRGLGEKVANKITDGRPYIDIKDFVKKNVVGPAMARKLIHIGVLDSLFEPNIPIMDKMQIYEDSVEELKYRKKIFDKIDEHIDPEIDLETLISFAKGHDKTKRMKHEVKKGKIDEKYIFMNPIKDYILKKSIFPTMPMNLHDLVKDSAKNVHIMKSGEEYFVTNPYGKMDKFIDGKTFQKIKNLPVQPNSDRTIKFCTTGYVIEAKEFSYKEGERKALKLNIDIDGYLEEFVIWPDYDSGILEYPEGIKKGSVLFLFMYRKMNKEKYHTNIDNVTVEDIPL